MSLVQEILSRKSGNVLTVSPDTDLLDAVRTMNSHRVGSLVVTEGHRVVGMFTERDVLKAVAATGCDLRRLTVRDAMTRDVVTTSSNADLSDVSEQMKDRRIRHMPVVNEMDQLCGLVSIGDLNAWNVELQARHLEGLNEYIYGRA